MYNPIGQPAVLLFEVAPGAGTFIRDDYATFNPRQASATALVLEWTDWQEVVYPCRPLHGRLLQDRLQMLRRTLRSQKPLVIVLDMPQGEPLLRKPSKRVRAAARTPRPGTPRPCP